MESIDTRYLAVTHRAHEESKALQAHASHPGLVNGAGRQDVAYISNVRYPHTPAMFEYVTCRKTESDKRIHQQAAFMMRAVM